MLCGGVNICEIFDSMGERQLTQVTADMCLSVINRVVKEEDKMWQMNTVDDCLVINIGNTSTESNSDSDVGVYKR